MIQSNNNNKKKSAKHKNPEFVFKEKSWPLHQRLTFQSSRNLPTMLPAQPGRFRQQQAQPMWDVSSQSQTTLPWHCSSREGSGVEKHLGLVCTAEWVGAAHSQQARGAETTQQPLCKYWNVSGKPTGHSGLSWVWWKEAIHPNRVGPICSLRSCNSSGKFSFDNYLSPYLTKCFLFLWWIIWQALKGLVGSFFVGLPSKQFCFGRCVVWNKSSN